MISRTIASGCVLLTNSLRKDDYAIVNFCNAVLE
jgi:hypothetical protein